MKPQRRGLRARFGRTSPGAWLGLHLRGRGCTVTGPGPMLRGLTELARGSGAGGGRLVLSNADGAGRSDISRCSS